MICEAQKSEWRELQLIGREGERGFGFSNVIAKDLHQHPPSLHGP